MKIIFPSCVLNCQFRMYVNLSACTTIISGWVVVVSSFRDGRCVCVHACAHMCVSILSAHQCFWGFLLGPGWLSARAVPPTPMWPWAPRLCCSQTGQGPGC